MSRLSGSRVIRPRADYYEEYGEGHTFIGGHADFAQHPWDWDDATAQDLADELQATLDRKKPLGFAPWPD